MNGRQNGFDWLQILCLQRFGQIRFHLSLDNIVGSTFYLVEGKFGSDTILSNCCQTGYTTREMFKGNDITFCVASWMRPSLRTVALTDLPLTLTLLASIFG